MSLFITLSPSISFCGSVTALACRWTLNLDKSLSKGIRFLLQMVQHKHAICSFTPLTLCKLRCGSISVECKGSIKEKKRKNCTFWCVWVHVGKASLGWVLLGDKCCVFTRQMEIVLWKILVVRGHRFNWTQLSYCKVPLIGSESCASFISITWMGDCGSMGRIVALKLRVGGCETDPIILFRLMSVCLCARRLTLNCLLICVLVCECLRVCECDWVNVAVE